MRYLLFFALALNLTGCITYNRCQSKFGHLQGDSVKVMVKVTVHDTVKIIIPGETIISSPKYNIDSLLNVLDTVREISASKKLEVDLWRDKATHRLNYKAIEKRDTVERTIIRTIHERAECPPIVNFEPRNKWWEAIKLGSFFILLGELIILAILWRLNKLKI